MGFCCCNARRYGCFRIARARETESTGGLTCCAHAEGLFVQVPVAQRQIHQLRMFVDDLLDATRIRLSQSFARRRMLWSRPPKRSLYGSSFPLSTLNESSDSLCLCGSLGM